METKKVQRCRRMAGEEAQDQAANTSVEDWTLNTLIVVGDTVFGRR